MSWEYFCKWKKLNKCYQKASLQDIDGVRREIADSWVSKPFSLVLYGDVGRGKTHMMYALIRALCEKYKKHDKHGMFGSNIGFYKSKQMDDQLLEMFNQYGTASHFLQKVTDYEWMFWDDFGVDRLTDRTIREFTDIIDQRMDKVTVISTNLNHEQVQELYGPRLLSRLKPYEWFRLGGSDMRGEKTRTRESSSG